MKRNFRSKLTGLLGVTAAFALAATLPAYAGFSNGHYVTFQGEPMFAIKGSCAGLSAERRAWVAQDNLDNALALVSDHSPSAVQVVRVNGGYTVQVGGRYILTADSGSAAMEGKSAQALADSWADAIRDRLANAADAERYIATLRDEHALKANVSVTETDIVRASDDGVPFRMAEGNLSFHPSLKDHVVLVLKKAVTVENTVLPERSVLTGVVTKDAKGEFVTFTTATIPGGESLALTNVIASASFTTDAPHPVLTMNMPADPKTQSRVPALVGIGAQEASIAVIEERSNMVAAKSAVDVQM